MTSQQPGGVGFAYGLGLASGAGFGVLAAAQVAAPVLADSTGRVWASIAGAAVAVLAGTVFWFRFRR